MSDNKKGLKILIDIIFVLSEVICLGLSILREVIGYYHKFFPNASLEALLFTLRAPKTNSNMRIVGTITKWCLPRLPIYLIVIVLSLVIDIIIQKKIKSKSLKSKHLYIYRIAVVFSTFIFVVSTYLLLDGYLGITNYFTLKIQQTTIYEEDYTSPKDVNISADGDTNNLIYIYMESMESSYIYETDDGSTVDLTPNLTKLAEDNISFSNTTDQGGFYSPTGTNWTMAGLLSTSCGLPLSFSINGHDIVTGTKFAPGVTALGDILKARGYNLEFMCGSDCNYGGRELYYQSHGNWNIFDFFRAFPSGHDEYNNNWWGFEDKKLYSYAKEKITDLASQQTPFVFTMLTVDTHFGDGITDGYVCELCGNEYSDRYANVIKCADNQIGEFISWVQSQDFYDNTTIIITGDHPFMGIHVQESTSNGYTVYNCIINSKKEAEYTKNRTATSFDIFPTTLSAMGFDIESNRLGLGTDLFSNDETLAERIGLDRLNEELSKTSEYYIDNFE